MLWVLKPLNLVVKPRKKLGCILEKFPLYFKKWNFISFIKSHINIFQFINDGKMIYFVDRVRNRSKVLIFYFPTYFLTTYIFSVTILIRLVTPDCTLIIN